MFVFQVSVPRGLVVEAEPADGAEVRPGVGVRVLVLGQGELGGESLGAVVALEWLGAVLRVHAQDVDLPLGVAGEALGTESAREIQLFPVDQPARIELKQ